MTKVVLSAALALGVAVAVATPASADPSVFGVLGCSCQNPAAVSAGQTPPADQVSQGMRAGSAEVQGLRG